MTRVTVYTHDEVPEVLEGTFEVTEDQRSRLNVRGTDKDGQNLIGIYAPGSWRYYRLLEVADPREETGRPVPKTDDHRGVTFIDLSQEQDVTDVLWGLNDLAVLSPKAMVVVINRDGKLKPVRQLRFIHASGMIEIQ